MRELTALLVENAKKLPKAQQAKIKKFANRLESYSWVPSNKKESQRMNAFASDQELIVHTLEAAKQYSYPNAYDHTFDIITYWYCLSLFAESDIGETREFVRDLATAFLESKHKDLWMFRRSLQYRLDDDFDDIRGKIESYFISKQNKLESYIWAKEIGLELPSDDNWRFYFRISTDGEFRSRNSLPDNQKRTYFWISTSVYPLNDDQCWEIEVKNMSRTISAWWPVLHEKGIQFEYDDDTYEIRTLKTTPSLRNLKPLIEELENLLDVTFDRNICTKRFSGKIRNKPAIQKWLLDK